MLIFFQHITFRHHSQNDVISIQKYLTQPCLGKCIYMVYVNELFSKKVKNKYVYLIRVIKKKIKGHHRHWFKNVVGGITFMSFENEKITK